MLTDTQKRALAYLDEHGEARRGCGFRRATFQALQDEGYCAVSVPKGRWGQRFNRSTKEWEIGWIAVDWTVRKAYPYYPPNVTVVRHGDFRPWLNDAPTRPPYRL